MANAFNTARWDDIKETASKKANLLPHYLVGIIDSYLNRGSLIYGDNKSRSVTCGVPQGPVLGPLL